MVDQTPKQAFVHAAGAGGAWAAVLTYGRHRREVHGTEPGAPADRMALTAVVAGLECLTRPTAVEVRVHSDYVRGGGEGGLWERLRAATRTHKVTWAWSGDYPELAQAQEMVGSAAGAVLATADPLDVADTLDAASTAAEMADDASETADAALETADDASGSGAALEEFAEALGEHVANDPDGPDPAELVELADTMIEDEHRAIVAVGPRAITFEEIGAVAVPPEIAAQARVGWRILLSAAHVEGNWYLLDVAG
ncbi:hypothetical protein ABT369_22250 [Dactylosporangium sp. NPDC000244]|uniref:hypothetical protein n=1 Tax=Dactylosporangium sp. NPDC000244 TaxID=3154365 RepID=UPI0033274E6B